VPTFIARPRRVAPSRALAAADSGAARPSPRRRHGLTSVALRALAALGIAVAASTPVAARSLVVYCSHDPDACELAAQTFTKDTGIAATISRKPTGEVYAQIRAERENPKADVWYGGTIEPFLQGAAEGLFAPYRSPGVAGLHPWAQRQAERTRFQVTPIYRIIVAFGANAALLAKRGIAAPRCWSDLVKPDYRGEIELSNPVTSGTGYTIVATLVALYGEDAAFDYLRRLKPNVVRWTQSGTAQGPSVARGEVAVGVTFAHEFITQQLAGFPVDVAIPCEGTGDALGGMAIVADAPHPVEARAFVDWALTKDAQELANRTRNLLLPANRAAAIRPEAARYAGAKMADVDPARFGAPDERKRLLARWQREIGDAPR
jgi:iron(III) transport system substrate-binding protein